MSVSEPSPAGVLDPHPVTDAPSTSTETHSIVKSPITALESLEPA